jgi:hypothetical protein
MAPAPPLPASPKPKFAKPQVASCKLIQDFGSLSVGASGPEQQRQATAVLVPGPEQFASRNSATTLCNASVSIEEAHQALAIVLQFLEQDQLLHKPSKNILNKNELSTMRSLAENLGHERLHAGEDGRSRQQGRTRADSDEVFCGRHGAIRVTEIPVWRQHNTDASPLKANPCVHTAWQMSAFLFILVHI